MISVCMATYNGEKYIKLQIESILREISSEDELIIQDDDSKDSTLEIIRDFRDSRILLHINEKNIGVILTFENVLKKARGSIIFLADQDDEWLPGKVELVMNEFDKPRVMAVVTNAVIVDSEGKTVMPSYFAAIGSGPGVLKNYLHNSYLGCCLAFRKTVLLSGLPIPHEVRTHDGWLGLVANMIGDVVFINTPLLNYRRHGGNVSQMHRFPMIDVVKRRIYLMKNMIRVWPGVIAARRALKKVRKGEPYE